MTETLLLPDHYRTQVRRLVRFGMVFLVVGLLIGVMTVEYQKSFRYGPTNSMPRLLDDETRKAERTRATIDLPPGLMWEVGIDLRLSHGHVILIGAVVPLCIAGALVLTRLAGGGEIGRGALEAAFWLYVVGGSAGMGLIFYKGLFLVHAFRDGMFDLREVHAAMFGGSRALKGAAYGISHSVMAVAVGIYAVTLWRSAASIGSSFPAKASS